MTVVRSHHRPAEFARLVPSPLSLGSVLATGWPWLFWLCWGVWLAVSDLGATDVQPAVLRLMLGAFVLGCTRPARWWAWSLALAAWVPAEPLVASAIGLPSTFEYNFSMWVLPPIPALVGGFLGRSLVRGVLPRTVRTTDPVTEQDKPEA